MRENQLRFNSGTRRRGPAKWVLFILLVAIAAAGCTTTIATPVPETSTSLPTPTTIPTTEPGTATATSEATLGEASGETVPAPTQEDPMTAPDESTPSPLYNLPQVAQSRTDLADRLDLPTDAIEVIEVETVTWSDTSMGCPQPGMAYKQVPQDGLLIRLRAGGQEYEYHSGGTRAPFLCEQQVRSEKPTPLSLDDFITPSSPDLDE